MPAEFALLPSAMPTVAAVATIAPDPIATAPPALSACVWLPKATPKLPDAVARLPAANELVPEAADCFPTAVALSPLAMDDQPPANA